MTREEKALWGFFLWTSFFLGFVLSAVGCSSVPRAFLEGEQAAFRAISGPYVAYVASDSTLTKRQREGRLRTVRAWRFSLEKAAGAAGD